MIRLMTAVVGWGAALLMITASGWVSYQSTAASIEAMRWVGRSHEVMAELEAVLLAITDAEAASQGYVIASAERHLEPFASAIVEIDHGLERLRHLTADNPNQQQRISLLKPLIDQKIAQIRHSIDLQRAEGFQPDVQITLTDQGKKLKDQVRWIIETMKAEERTLLAYRDELSKSHARITSVTIPLGVGLSVGLLFLVVYLYMREVGERMRLEDELRKAKETAEVADGPSRNSWPK
jgi:CHASE3 domain sensor protein